MMTAKEYIDSLRKLNTRVYMFGEKLDNWVDHPMIRPSINCVAMTYALAQDPQYEELMTATSSLTGHKINRFTHLHQSADDLVKKVKMQRLLGQKTASCFQRCVGMDAFNAVYSTTYEIDEKCGTHYHENFKKFLAYVQDNDLTVDGAMTDPKGDRSKAPHDQADPDMYVHVVERRDDGIVVCGAKCHQTGSVNSHWHIFMPTIAMGEADKDWAISFACPADAEGLYISVLIRPHMKAESMVFVTAMTAVAMARAIERTVDADAVIKWVNDIFVRGKKVCGILCESAFDADALSEYVVIGAGVNITEPSGGFPADISAVAGALLPHGRGQELRSRLAAAFLEELFSEYARLDSRSFLDEYRRRSMVTGKNVSVISPTLTRHGKAIAIDDDCRLVVRFDDGTTEHVSTGEISVRVD